MRLLWAASVPVWRAWPDAERETRTVVSEIAPAPSRQAAPSLGGPRKPGEEAQIGHVACCREGMWLTEELREARRLHDARAAPRSDARGGDDRGNAARTDAHGFELRYRSLSRHRCGYAFPCDAEGRVNLDQLSERARANYLYARAMVGLDLLQPEVALVR